MLTAILNVVATAVAAVAAVYAAKSSERSATAAVDSIAAAKSIADTQKLLSQRQLLVPLWDHMIAINEIDPSKPSPIDALTCVHTLELVAVCCEGGMVDEQVIKRTFRDVFIKTYDQIESCPEMPALRRDGKTLLRENPASDAGSWWTKAQVAHIEPLVAGAFLDDLEHELEGGEGLSITLERPPSAGPRALETEPNDMRRVASSCHADEPVKVVEGWTGPIHFLRCGAVFRG